ncbi:hypothetical protein TRVA0_006S03796 [Trichomonascus vanleenenianus]|uniref:uncharacterized protein n=1 Tax=Trichomonascus vanleenenianus TaxID=2268995 RepID=UPI003ECA6F76
MGFELADLVQGLSSLIPRRASYTEKDYADLSDKVYLVTGGTAGIGFEAVRLLAGQNAKVYTTSRSLTKFEQAAGKIRGEFPNARVEPIVLDYHDLATIKPAISKLLNQESVLHGVIHNAGVLTPPDKFTAQGIESHLGVNSVAPWLVQTLLDDLMIKTAECSPQYSVRVVWVSSLGLVQSPDKGIDWSNLKFEKSQPADLILYGQSKAVNAMSCMLWSDVHRDSGVVSLSLHPGTVQSELTRSNQTYIVWLSKLMVFFGPIEGAYNELYALLSPELTTEDNGSFLVPPGRIGHLRRDILEGAKGDDGQKLLSWLNDTISPFK